MTMIESLDDSEITPVPRRRMVLERGHVKHELIRRLAAGEALKTLAEEFGVATSSVHAFKGRHLTEIDALKERLHDDFAGLWIAQKGARLAELQADVELINESTGPEIKKMTEVAMLQLKERIIRAVAEELGDIPTKVSVNVSQKITYEVVGVDVNQLR